MVYQPDDPDLGPPHTIDLITQTAHHIPIFESLRHNRPASPSSPASIPQLPKPPPHTPLSLHQQVLLPPTDAECGLPDLYTATLSAIPKSHLALSKYLSRAPVATILHGYSRVEVAVSLAHALNLRRCNAEARAVLVLTTSEAAVREWVAALCPVLDDVQLISYSKRRNKRDAVLVRLRETQFPGVVVAAEKAAREGMSEIWAALCENRLIRKWDFVVSEALSDANVEGVCSPLRMVREGTAGRGLVLGKKGLSKTKATAVVRNVENVDVDSLWVRKKDVPDLAERFEKREEGAGERVRHTPDGKENRASLRNRDIMDAGNGVTKERQTSQGPVTLKRRSNSAVVKPAMGKQPSLRATTRLPTAVISRTQSLSNDVDKLASGTDSSTDLRRSSRIPVKRASGDAKADDILGERTGRTTVGPIKRRKPYNRIAPELLSQSQGPRRRSPRFSPPPSDESFLAPRSKPKPRRSTKSESIQEPVAILPVKVKRADSRSRGRDSSSGSVVLSRTEMTNEDDDNTTSSRRNREQVLNRGRALGIYDTSSGEDTFYTPPTHAMPPKSSSPSPDKYYTPRTSFSPKAVTDSSKSRRSSLLKVLSDKGSSSRSHERERAKSASMRYVPPKAKVAPLKIDGSGTNTRLNFSASESSDDEPLSTKFVDSRLEGARRRAHIFISPALTRKKASVRTIPEAPKRNQSVKRRSVFERLSIPSIPPSQKSSGVTRRHSLAGPVRVKHETDVVSGERPPGIPRHSFTETKNRRSSFQYTMRREDDLFNRDAPLPERMPRYSNVGKQNRRSSLPSTGSMLPLKRPSLENRGTYSVPRNLPRSASRARRASLDELRRRASPSCKAQNRELASKASTLRSGVGEPSRSPVRNTVPSASPVPLEVIIISDSEEETVRNVTPTKRRRLFANPELTRGTRRNDTVAGPSSGRIQDRKAEPRRATRRNNTGAGTFNQRTHGRNGEFSRGTRRNDTEAGTSSQGIHGRNGEFSRGTPRNDTEAGTSSQGIHGQNGETRRGIRRNDTEAGTTSRMFHVQNRTEPSDRSQVRSLRFLRDTDVSEEEDLATFMRNTKQSGKLTELTRPQRKKYDDHLKRAKRYQRMGRLKEAIESYRKCVNIYDGDPELINRYLALSSQQGFLLPTDFSPQPARSPIKKQSTSPRGRRRRRRNPDRLARVERSRSISEVIDLTCS